MRSFQASPAVIRAHQCLSSSDTSSAFSLLLSRLPRFFLHSRRETWRARIGLRRLRGRGNVIHFRHGQLAHGVLGVFWVAAGEKDVLYVTHVEESNGRRVRRSGACSGDFGARMIVR